jgi:hypothetical protein
VRSINSVIFHDHHQADNIQAPEKEKVKTTEDATHLQMSD